MTTTQNAADIRKSAIETALTVLDGESVCYCEGRQGQNHDVRPPCDQVRKATLIVDSISHLLVQPAA